MATTQWITTPGRIPQDHIILGEVPDLYGIGVIGRLPRSDDEIHFKKVTIKKCCDGLQIRRGKWYIDELIMYKTWGDSIKFHENSQLHIKKFRLIDPLHKLEHTDVYHVDRLIQGFARFPGRPVGNVTIEDIEIVTSAPGDKVMILSEGKDFYHNWNIGSKKLHIKCVNSEWLQAANVAGLTVGSETADIKIEGFDGTVPLIRIGSKESPIKETPFVTTDVMIHGSARNFGNTVPLMADTFLLARAEQMGMSKYDLQQLFT